jgi:hypothetical protein
MREDVKEPEENEREKRRLEEAFRLTGDVTFDIKIDRSKGFPRRLSPVPKADENLKKGFNFPLPTFSQLKKLPIKFRPIYPLDRAFQHGTNDFSRRLIKLSSLLDKHLIMPSHWLQLIPRVMALQRSPLKKCSFKSLNNHQHGVEPPGVIIALPSSHLPLLPLPSSSTLKIKRRYLLLEKYSTRSHAKFRTGLL